MRVGQFTWRPPAAGACSRLPRMATCRRPSRPRPRGRRPALRCIVMISSYWNTMLSTMRPTNMSHVFGGSDTTAESGPWQRLHRNEDEWSDAFFTTDDPERHSRSQNGGTFAYRGLFGKPSLFDYRLG